MPGVNASGTVMQGNGYTAFVPPGGQWSDLDPFGMNRMYFPPGAMPQPGPEACIKIEPIPPMQVQTFLMYMAGMDDAFIGTMNAQSMGVTAVLGIGPMRNTQIGGAMGYIREFDGIGIVTGLPYRFTMIVLAGPMSALKLTMGIRLQSWAVFTGPCLAFVGSISLAGAQPAAATTIRAVVDPNHANQVEYQLVNPDHSTAPITAMPMFVGSIQVVQIDQSIKTGAINGAVVAVGAHSIASVGRGESTS
jgi:hypothetical protein